MPPPAVTEEADAFEDSGSLSSKEAGFAKELREDGLRESTAGHQESSSAMQSRERKRLAVR
jgi:hypothetical protein